MNSSNSETPNYAPVFASGGYSHWVALLLLGSMLLAAKNFLIVLDEDTVGHHHGSSRQGQADVIDMDAPSLQIKQGEAKLRTEKAQSKVPPQNQTRDKLPPVQTNFNPSPLVNQLAQSRQELKHHLISFYGQTYYEDIFEPFDQQAKRRVNIGDHFFYKSPAQLGNKDKGFHRATHANNTTTATTLGWNRMVRKLKIKLYQAQLQQLSHGKNSHNSTTIIYRWITLGNGPASGAGNLFRETFTSVLEQALTKVFQSVGLTFQARNYAMASTSSGDEIALCLSQIIPNDGVPVDTYFWDYEMTDEGDFWKLALLAHRIAGSYNGSPIPSLVASHRRKEHTSLLTALERNGMAVLGRDTMVQSQLHQAIPDSSPYKTIEENPYPPHLQYLKCHKREWEEGGPKLVPPNSRNGTPPKKLCRIHKFNSKVCANRPFQHIWHPGWRFNALKGYILAWTMMELLQDAVEQLGVFQQQGDDTSLTAKQECLQEQLEKLQQQELADAIQFRTQLENPGIPNGVPSKWFQLENSTHALHRDIDLPSLFRQPAMCRTALIPSSSRFQVTKQQWSNTSSSSIVTTPYGDSYERGVFFTSIQKLEENLVSTGGYQYPEPERADQMVIVTDKDSYFKCPREALSIDRQDAFLVTSAMGWRSLTVAAPPQTTTSTAKGWVFICLIVCADSKCPPNDLHDRVCRKPFKETEDPDTMLRQYGQVELEVNGIPVTNATRLIQHKDSHLDNCMALKHEGSYVWSANQDGAYVIRARIVGAAKWSYLRISSAIVM